MRSPLNRVVFGAVLFLVTILVAVDGYVAAGWDVLDAIYMVVITIFGVGYGEVRPIDTDAMKVFTIFVIVVGTGSAVYIRGGIIQMTTEGEIKRALGARRKTRGIESLRNHAIICGYGRMGQILARELAAARKPFVIIDDDEARVEEADEQRGFLVIKGDATEEDTLREARVEVAQSLATVLPNDAMNVFITLSARNLNPDLDIHARGEIPATEAKLLQAGADHVVLPASIGGSRLAQMIIRPSTNEALAELANADHINDDLEGLGVVLGEAHIPEHSTCVGKTTSTVENEGAFLILAVRRKDGQLHKKPAGDFLLQAGDTVVVINHSADDPQLTFDKTETPELAYTGPEVTV